MKLVNTKFGLSALRSQKTRSTLTILGISIGIAVVIAIMSAGRGLNGYILHQLEIFGTGMFNVEVKVPSVKKTSTDNATARTSGVTITTLKDKDISTVAKYPNVSAAYGYIMGQAVAKYQDQTKTVNIIGEGYNAPAVQRVDLSAGRFFTKDEDSSLAQVAVLGSAVKDKLFGDDDAVGKTVYLKGKPFKVVGVSAKQGSAFFMDMDSIIILPVKTMQKRIQGVDYVSVIMAKMKDTSKSKQTVDDITAAIRENHNITDPNKDDFAVNTMEEAILMLESVVKGITILLVALVCISLIVGGVGIMNIMYVSVTERTFEIGLRKSVGAKSKDILRQFLSEAVMLTVAGGIAGIIFGALLALIIYYTAISYGLKWVYAIPISSIILAVGFSAFVGLLFGLYPAKKAASLNPIEALRKE